VIESAQSAWVLPLVRGLLALLLCALLFLAARHRWREREETRGPADIGLD
jgi:hypothetical protein